MILMYHRVAGVSRDPWDLAVAPEEFDRQVAFLKRHRVPLPMRELVERLREGTLPAKAVALTFDDGYRDNLVHAKPILARHGVPATVFVATGFTGTNTPFWWDELGQLILEFPDPLDREQACGTEMVRLAWELPETADFEGTWRAESPPQTARQRAYLQLWSRLQSASQEQRAKVLNDLRALFRPAQDPLALPMSVAEIEELQDGGLITVEPHSVTHPALTDLSRAESQWQIRESAQECRKLTGHPTPGFAYPYGNFDAKVCDDLSAAGPTWACTTEPHFLDIRPLDFRALPRFGTPNGPMEKFRRLITG